ncbi:GumC family protein [Silvibacterium dinghuense]|uniref:Uncharacterized protein n=1 Tax=Silvibacterium dinghuense TaxID=1560006 RepID=A0A4Q1SGQ1_9BACT|nr:polysaccharide biosynthesis tyrosine autokinase [Silvibacterium dinghuense]RXS96696.1 hypothetical protein ESZ00_01750 [Silvibacterium dinghuense]GGG92949.1 succinoglycan biosynthesis transport protein ExoP [Silvibacterium dinghuense]
MNEKALLAGRPLEWTDLLTRPRREWTMLDLWQVMRRRRRWVLWPTGAALLLATLYWLLATPRFQANGEIEVQRESAAAFGLDNSVNGEPSQAEGDSLDYSMTLETESKILESPTLALRVMHDLELETTHDYFPQRTTGWHLPAWLFFWRQPLEPLNIRLEDAPNRRYVALKIFEHHLKVKAEPGTRLIDVSYADPNPYLATAVVNRLLSALTEYTYQARFQATAQASDWLAGQLKGLRAQTQALEDRASRLQRDTGIYGDDAGHNIVLDRLTTLNQRLAAAETNRILMQAIAQAAESGDPELLPALSGGGGSGMPGYGPQLAVIQELRMREAALEAEIAENDARYGPAHPHTAELQAELTGVQRSIRAEAERMGHRARVDLDIAQNTENAARDAFEKQRSTADAMSNRTVAYQLARQEADSSRNVYEGLLAKLKQAGVLEGLRSTNLTVVAPAQVPPTHRPSSPRMLLVYACALIGGLFLGCTGGWTAERFDHSVRSLEQLEEEVGSPLLGILPEFSRRLKTRRRASWREILMRRESVSTSPLFMSRTGIADQARQEIFVEALCSLRTSLLRLRDGDSSQVVLITSAVAGEGKSTIAANLAGVLAQSGERVLLVDADLRRPGIYHELGMPAGLGLRHALRSKSEPAIQKFPGLPSLSVLCGSTAASMPAELLASAKMQELLREWRRNYDVVLLDSPPILPATDPALLAQASDVTILVARHGVTTCQAVHRSMALLREQIPETGTLRVVLNGISKDSQDFHDYYGDNKTYSRRKTA